MNEKPTWDDIRPMLKAASQSGKLKEEFGRALEKWCADVWNETNAKSDDFPTYFLREHAPLPQQGGKGE